MRIAHITWNFSPTSETFIYNFVLGVQQRGHDSHVITLERIMEKERPYDPVWVVKLPPRWWPWRAMAGLRRRLGFVDIHEQFFPFARKFSYEVLQKMQPDVIHAQFGPVGVMIAPIAYKLQIPLVVSFHGYDISTLLRDARWLEHYRQLTQHVDAVVANSNHTKHKLQKLGFREAIAHKIHVGIDLDRFLYQDPSLRFDGREVRCLHVGRLVPKKSPVRLIQAFAKARRQLSPALDLRLTIAGNGPLYNQVLKTIQEEDVADAVEMLGGVGFDRVLTLLQEAHLYTQYCETAPNGDEEGQGVTFVEASASGLPIVSTRHNGIPDVVLDGETGYLVDEGDVEGMAMRIAELARNPEQWRTMGRAGRDHVEANLTLEQQIDKTLALYEAILAQRGTRS